MVVISAMKLVELAKKWRKQAALSRSNIVISLPIIKGNGRAQLLLKGHFAVYTMEDSKRFMVPMCCLEDQVFKQLLEVSEEEFGPPGNGPIRLHCDVLYMEGLVTLIKRREAADRDLIWKAVITTWVDNGRRIASCSSSFSSIDYRRQKPSDGEGFLVSGY